MTFDAHSEQMKWKNLSLLGVLGLCGMIKAIGKAREDKSSPRKGQECSNKKTQGRRKRKNSESSGQEEEQEDCSANPKCQRPVGKEVKIT